jgi:hypothetical protein
MNREWPTIQSLYRFRAELFREILRMLDSFRPQIIKHQNNNSNDSNIPG